MRMLSDLKHYFPNADIILKLCSSDCFLGLYPLAMDMWSVCTVIIHICFVQNTLYGGAYILSLDCLFYGCG